MKRMGRLVRTHSTYIDGLIPLLKKVSSIDGIKTVTPGIIKKVKGKSNNLQLRISVKIIGGYKLIARKGFSMQEVFIVTNLNRAILEDKINEELRNKKGKRESN
tara:strand:+ start:502 stop:813 length:312 start_codon:yes stop_codon:yes gene_type:complete